MAREIQDAEYLACDVFGKYYKDPESIGTRLYCYVPGDTGRQAQRGFEKTVDLIKRMPASEEHFQVVKTSQLKRVNNDKVSGMDVLSEY